MSSIRSWKRCGGCLLLAVLSACARSELRAPPPPVVSTPKQGAAADPKPGVLASAPARGEAPSLPPASSGSVAPSPEMRLLLEHDGTELTARYDAATCRATGRATLQVDVVALGQQQKNFELGAQARSADAGGAQAPCEGYLQSVEIADFDFDGYADVALPLDTTGPYGSLTYDMLLFRPETNGYARSAVLSQLTETFIGLPQVDAKRKRLTSFSKSGCCVHWWSEASFVNGKLLEERSETETYDLSGDGCRVITEATQRGQKPVKKTRACTAEERR